jgi:predicted enzyme related to lactoylglutathione lyase
MMRQGCNLTGRFLLMFGLAAGLCASNGPHAVGASFEVPPLCDPANDTHHVGKLIWLDLETTDRKAAKRFYRGLFGWDYRDYHADGVDYTVALMNGHAVAGMVRRRIVNDAERPSAWLPFFSVGNVNATSDQALQANAQARSLPEDLPLRGRQARLADPEGAVFALLSSSSGDPPDDPNPRPIGAWGWPSLLARDPAQEAVFYQHLLNYAVLGSPMDKDFQSIELTSGENLRADVRPMPARVAAVHPQWIAFVRVFSTADTTRMAIKLGAHVLVDRTHEARGAISSILVDPTGAAFGILELPPEVVERNAR